jgi:hypothetical protein
LQHESGSVRELRERSTRTEVPDEGADDVVSGLECRREIEGLVAPVEKVSAGRPVADALSIDVQDESIVSADVNFEFFGNAR